MLSFLRALVLLSIGLVYALLLCWSSAAFVDTPGLLDRRLFVRRCISAARLSSSLSHGFGLVADAAGRLSRSRITIRLMPGETARPLTGTRASQSVFFSTLHAYFPSLAIPAKARGTSSPMASNPSPGVAMTKERELSVRLDVILSALIAGSLAWMCCTRFRRYRTAQDVPVDFFRSQRTLGGVIASIPDGDGIRFYHQPAVFLGRHPDIARSDLRFETISVRIAGIDAPEMGHFGQPEQPFARAAISHLTSSYLGKRCRVQLFRVDQYGRVVAAVHVKRHWWWPTWTDVGQDMLERGLACVYRGMGAEYGGRRAFYEAAEASAKYTVALLLMHRRKKRGMWSQKACVMPGEYKRALREGAPVAAAPSAASSKCLVQ